ncbi:MAG: N-acyl homoserine lactonase family protein [Bauldia sp.]|nr:N-acyl homoserine lactonase family protein [Bauldia sp.]
MERLVTAIKRLFVLLCGFEIIPKTISTRDRGERFIISVPITAYLLDTTEGWVLFDTGLDAANLREPRLTELYTSKGWDPPPVVRPSHDLASQLAAIGISFADIGHVILSHLHADHSGHLKHLRHARVTIQRREYDYAFSGKARPSWFPSDYDFPDIDWHLIDGDFDVMSGLQILDTRGHSPGHQSLVVELPQTGTVVLAADVGDLMENFEQEILPGESVDDEAALAAIRRLNRIVAEQDAMLLLTHDPDQVQRIRLAPDCYD